MATRTHSSPQARNRNGEFAPKKRGSVRLFGWSGKTAGAMLSAAVVGAAVIVVANLGRKLIVQGMSATAGEWDEVLAAEHRRTLDIFDKMLSTDQSQKIKRGMLLTKLTHTLDKHAHEEEMVVFPALREANDKADTDQLEQAHGEVKTYLFRLGEMATDAPQWLETVREFRDSVARHARMEEDEVFPRLKSEITPEQSKHITGLVNKDGFMMA